MGHGGESTTYPGMPGLGETFRAPTMLGLGANFFSAGGLDSMWKQEAGGRWRMPSPVVD